MSYWNGAPGFTFAVASYKGETYLTNRGAHPFRWFRYTAQGLAGREVWAKTPSWSQRNLSRLVDPFTREWLRTPQAGHLVTEFTSRRAPKTGLKRASVSDPTAYVIEYTYCVTMGELVRKVAEGRKLSLHEAALEINNARVELSSEATQRLLHLLLLDTI